MEVATVKTTMKTYELQVGDIWAGHTITQIEKPASHLLEYTYIVTFSDHKPITSGAQSEWLIERKVERIYS